MHHEHQSKDHTKAAEIIASRDTSSTRNRRRALLAVAILATLSGCSRISEFFERKGATTTPATTAGATPSPGAAAAPVPGAGLPGQIDASGFRLANGLKVVLHQDASLPSVEITTWYHVGAKNEPGGKTGLANLTARMMFGATKHAKDGYLTHAGRAGALSDDVGVSVDSDRTMFTLALPPASLAYGLWLEADRMGFAFEKITPEDLGPPRRAMLEETRARLSQPWGGQNELFAEMMYPLGHPYSRPSGGRAGDVGNLTPDDVRNFHQAWFAPSNATLVVAGNLDIEATKALVGRYFGPLAPGPSITRIKSQAVKLDDTRIVVKAERDNRSPKVSFAWHTGPAMTAEATALELAGFTLGWGSKARLVERLVNKDRLATRVATSVQPREISSLFVVEVVPASGATWDGISAAVTDEIARFARSGPTTAELDTARAQRAMSLAQTTERLSGRAERLARFTAMFDDPGAAGADAARAEAVTSSDVSAAVVRWISTASHLELRFVSDPSGQADTAESDRATPPPVAEALTPVKPTIERKTLQNGLELVLLPRSAARRIDTMLIFKSNELGETAQTTGLAWVAAAAVNAGLQRDTKVVQRLEKLASQVGIDGDRYGITIAVSALRDEIEPVLSTMAGVLKDPKLDPEIVEEIKKARRDGIAREDADVARVAEKLMPRLLFPDGHPARLSEAGTTESMRTATDGGQISDAAVRTWLAANLRPGNAALVMSGALTMDEAQKIVTSSMGSWKGDRAVQAPATPPATAAGGAHRVHLLDARGSDAVEIRLAGALPGRITPDLTALLAANSVLGGDAAARLARALGQRNAASRAFSGVTLRKDFGWWTINVASNQTEIANALATIRTEIESLAAARPPTTEEVNNFRRTAARAHIQNLETSVGLMRLIAPSLAADLPLTTTEMWIESVGAETPASIAAAAGRHFDFARAITLVIGDAEKLRGPLSALGWGSVTLINPDGSAVQPGG